MDLIRGEREQKCFRPDCSKVCNINFDSAGSLNKISPCTNDGKNNCLEISKRKGSEEHKKRTSNIY